MEAPKKPLEEPQEIDRKLDVYADRTAKLMGDGEQTEQ
jgi:hypothetical protein